jgi:hypothetical protein
VSRSGWAAAHNTGPAIDRIVRKRIGIYLLCSGL